MTDASVIAPEGTDLMRAVRIAGDGVVVAQIPRPHGEGVRVKIGYAGICGSDLGMISGGTDEGVVLGHELAGWTEDGTPVSIEPILPCRECAACRAGFYNICEVGGSTCLGLVAERDGGMADEIIVPASALIELPAGLDVANACLIEPIAVGLHGLHRAELTAGERLLVIGGGAVGLLAAATGRALGAEVDIAVRHPHQRALADLFGAGEPEGTYDVVLVAATGDATVRQALDSVAYGGRIVYIALIDGPLLPGEAISKEISAVTSMGYNGHGPREVDEAAAILAAHPELSQVITHRFPLDRAEEAFAVARDRSAGAIKVVLEP
ncbi:zinc-dependent alcohol dehydrogenase [Microbacterium gorillae]|uniref:zinc-dependent alcohol dehydrogenase n=1 Tax=Microbacterium gorillae TaxID=1231063 RepID=UPI0006938450|nr:alcohol dehydrogenase catalytic domain-containing protein [Microbacterium gorillae]